jgi:DnaJ-class molecular chaperone
MTLDQQLALDCPRQAALSAPGQPPCKQCSGSGKVHSHNDICWVCDGTGHAPGQKEGGE